MKEIKDFESFLHNRYKELSGLYKKDKDENKKYTFNSQLVNKLLKMDESAHANLEDMVSLLESVSRGVDVNKLRDLNSMLNDVNDEMVKFMFLKNSVFKKIMTEHESDNVEGGN